MAKDKTTAVFEMGSKVPASQLSINSQEQFDTAMKDILQINSSPRGFCRGEPLTDRGKRKQLLKMLALLFIPVVALWCLALQGLSDDVIEKNDAEKTLEFLRFTIDIGKVARHLQTERDLSAFFYTALGPSTKSFLLDEYSKTDAALTELSDWPVDLDRNKRPEFATKEAFRVSVAAHRVRLGGADQDFYKELTYYSTAIDVFVTWLYDSLKESKYGTTWKSLVAYVKIISAREDVGYERSLGSIFFVNGQFVRPDDYHLYLRKYFTARAQFRVARNFSPLVMSVVEYGVKFEEKNLTNVISAARKEIRQYGNIGLSPSISKGQSWYDSMSLYLDILQEQQTDIAARISSFLDANIESKINKVVVSSILLVTVLILSPFVFMAIQSLTSDIQRFALTLVDKTKELSREKRKTDSLIYQMVPKPIAETLKKSGEVEAEYFKEVTVFFSAIVGFAKISSEISPMEVVGLLNNLYKFMDGVLDRYDVYKVETINDTYMVTSGLPRRNKKHATELSDLSLELMELIAERQAIFLSKGGISLRIGLNTGPVVAGVVGSKMPRYCLFGDTVNTASRLETNGLPNRIHIGAATRRLLLKRGGYVVQNRGTVHLKGKGNVLTYWLVGKGENTADIEPVLEDSDFELPGEITYGSKDATKIIFKPSSIGEQRAGGTQSSVEKAAFDRSQDFRTRQLQEGFDY